MVLAMARFSGQWCRVAAPAPYRSCAAADVIPERLPESIPRLLSGPGFRSSVLFRASAQARRLRRPHRRPPRRTAGASALLFGALIMSVVEHHLPANLWSTDRQAWIFSGSGSERENKSRPTSTCSKFSSLNPHCFIRCGWSLLHASCWIAQRSAQVRDAPYECLGF